MRSEKLSEMLKDLDEDLVEETDRIRSEKEKRTISWQKVWIYAAVAVMIGFLVFIMVKNPWKRNSAIQPDQTESQETTKESSSETAIEDHEEHVEGVFLWAKASAGDSIGRILLVQDQTTHELTGQIMSISSAKALYRKQMREIKSGTVLSVYGTSEEIIKGKLTAYNAEKIEVSPDEPYDWQAIDTEQLTELGFYPLFQSFEELEAWLSAAEKSINDQKEVLKNAADELIDHPEEVYISLIQNDTGMESSCQLLYYTDGTERKDDSSAAFTWDYYVELLTGQRHTSVEILLDPEESDLPDGGNDRQVLHFRQGSKNFLVTEDCQTVQYYENGTGTQILYKVTPDVSWFTREASLFFWLRKAFDILEYEDYCHENGYTPYRSDYNIRIEDRGQSMEEVVREFNETWIIKAAENDMKLSDGSRFQDAYREIFLTLPEKKMVNDWGAVAVYATIIYQPSSRASAEEHGILPEDEIAYAYKKVYDGRFDDIRLGGEIPEGEYPTFYSTGKTFLLKNDGYYELFFGDMGTDDPWRDSGFYEID